MPLNKETNQPYSEENLFEIMGKNTSNIKKGIYSVMEKILMCFFHILELSLGKD